MQLVWKIFFKIFFSFKNSNITYLNLGTYGDKKTAEYVHNFWLLEGLDETKIIDYDVLLDFTDDIKYNK